MIKGKARFTPGFRAERLQQLLPNELDALRPTGRDALRQALSTLGLAAGLISYSNAAGWIYMRTERKAPTDLNPSHLAMLACVLSWAAAERHSLRELGLGRRGIGRSAGWGLLFGALAAIAIHRFFTYRIVNPVTIRHPELERLSGRRLVSLFGAQILVGAAVFEEVAFRGLLHAKLARLLGTRSALFVGSAIFTAWHIVITWYNVRRSNLPRRLFAPAYAAALLVVFGAGLLFGTLRQATGHLAGSIVAHWLAVANIVLAIERSHRRRR